MREEQSQFLPLGQAAQILGVDRSRVRDLIRRGELHPFEDPLDRRRTLLAVEDLDRLRQPRQRGALVTAGGGVTSS